MSDLGSGSGSGSLTLATPSSGGTPTVIAPLVASNEFRLISTLHSPIPASAMTVAPRSGIREYRDLTYNKGQIKDIDFWHLHVYFADEMDLSSKEQKIKNTISVHKDNS